MASASAGPVNPVLKALLDGLKAIITKEELQGTFGDLFPLLQASECLLIDLLQANNYWTGAVPVAPVLPPNVKPQLEFGLMPYWINNPPSALTKWVTGGSPLEEVFDAIWTILKILVPTNISPAEYATLTAALKANGLVGPDGTIYGQSPYDQLDEGWSCGIFDYILSKLITKVLGPGSFPDPANTKPISITGSTAGTVTIAMVGDWGTGDANATAIMSQITAANPDYIIHLGDVYYAGTGDFYVPLLEESLHLLDSWPAAYSGKSFTLNSNHEMYSRGAGYAGALKHDVFKAQNQQHCFALQFGDWTVAGLDSAFFSTSDMYFDGSIGGSTGVQGSWLSSLKLNPQKTIVLTHHNGIEWDCSGVMGLWAEVQGALGSDPYAWYWGHVHDGIMYNQPIDIAGIAPFSSQTYARCLGHGALPYGIPYGLNGAAGIAWFEQTPVAEGSNLVKNGFVMLTLTLGSSGSEVASVTEAFYEAGNDTPVKSLQIFGSQN